MPSAPSAANQSTTTTTSDGAAGRILKKGIIVEVIYDPSLYGKEWQAANVKALSLKNGSRIHTAPRNSCIVRQYGAGKGAELDTLLVFPFFPPHLCFPIKPGESVWLISPGIGALDENEVFWISRIASTSLVDDPNYACLQRSAVERRL